MTAFSLFARLHLGANSRLALSLPQSRLCILWARQLCPLAVLRSCFGYSLSHLRTAAACLSRCIRHRRRSKAKPLRGSRGGSAASRRIARVRVQLSPPKAGCPHPSRCGAKAPHRATFPKGKARRLRRRYEVRQGAHRRASYLLFRSAKKCGAKPALLLS